MNKTICKKKTHSSFVYLFFFVTRTEELNIKKKVYYVKNSFRDLLPELMLSTTAFKSFP